MIFLRMLGDVLKVLMTSAPAVGHVVPLLGIGQALREAGHAVRVATHPDVHPLITEAGLHSAAAGMSGQAMRQERVRRWPDTQAQPATAWALRMFTAILGPTTLTDLLVLCDEWKPDIVIHEEGEYAGPVAAARTGIPWVTHAWGSPLRSIDELAALDQYAGPLWESVDLTMPRWGGLYQHGLLNPCPQALQTATPGTALTWPLRTMPLAGPEDRAAVEEGWPDVYVGFGTVPSFAEDEVLLAAAVQACASRGLRTVVTTSDTMQAQRLAAGSPALVKAGTFVDLAEVLPSCRMVVCHGGAGTVLAALESGVPLVIIPKGTPSQHRMAAGCVGAGVAVVAGSDPVSIAAAIAWVLDNDRFRDRAAALAEEIRGMPAPSDVVSVLTALASSD
jgi:UDP:flavonoid glycosyltransferase YjiC (YdhE family)